MATKLFDGADRRLFAFVLGIFERGGSPEKFSRGVAAGVLGAFFPSSILRFVAAILSSMFFRGNKAAALVAPAVASVFEFQGLLKFQASLAGGVWPGGAKELFAGASALYAANMAWTWPHPVHSALEQAGAVHGLTFGAAAALFATVMLTGLAAGAAAYPVSLIAVSFFYDAKSRTKQFLRMGGEAGFRPFIVPLTPLSAAPLSCDDVRALYCGKKHRFMQAASARLLIDGGQAYPEMLAAIEAARVSLVLETYILRDDKFGTLFAEALKSAALRGVKTRLIYDGVGSMGLPEAFVVELAQAGVEARVFHPISSIWRGGFGFLQRRDHRKIIVSDMRVSLLGGLNIADEYAAVADGGGGWRDTHVRLEGEESARALTHIFEETWAKSEPALRRKIEPQKQRKGTFTLPTPAGEDWTAAASGAPRAQSTSENVSIEILNNRELLSRMRIKRAYLNAIRAAKRYILIENAFFIPDRDVLRALYKAVRRGVKVAVVVAMNHDIRFAAMASRALYDELLANGVRLFEYPIAMIHSKVAAIDDRWSIVSSYNLNHRSLLHDLEVAVQFCDEKFAVAMRDQILKDITKCAELTKEAHRGRPWNIALTESICYQFRYWL